jgi:hypothetical protein
MSNIEAMRAALEAAQNFIDDVHFGEWAGKRDRRALLLHKISVALAQAEQRQDDLKPGQYVIRYNSDGEFGQATGWLYRDGGQPCVVTGRPVYVWRPLSQLMASVEDREFWLSVIESQEKAQPEEPKQRAPGLYLESGEFIPAEELNKTRNQE